MNEKSNELFKNASVEDISNILNDGLKSRKESPFWSDKVVPFSEAILSVLIPLRENNMLFNPEGKAQEELTLKLYLLWSDFVSLKTLAFTIQHSNEAGKLLRTSLETSKCEKYKNIDLTILGDYLAKYNVNLENESLDFPISHYNLHQGVSNVIKSILL